MVGCAILTEGQSCYFHFLGDKLKHGEVATCHSTCSEPLGEPDAPQPMAGSREHRSSFYDKLLVHTTCAKPLWRDLSQPLRKSFIQSSHS